jgi:hypothetical protein
MSEVPPLIRSFLCRFDTSLPAESSPWEGSHLPANDLLDVEVVNVVSPEEGLAATNEGNLFGPSSSLNEA